MPKIFLSYDQQIEKLKNEKNLQIDDEAYIAAFEDFVKLCEQWIGHSKATKEEDVPFILQHENKLKHFHINGLVKNTFRCLQSRENLGMYNFGGKSIWQKRKMK